jgi:hypothetical protein
MGRLGAIPAIQRLPAVVPNRPIVPSSRAHFGGPRDSSEATSLETQEGRDGYDDVMVTFSIRWVTSGGTPEELPCALIFSTTFKPEVTRPNREYEFGSDSPCVPAIMNHWLPPL